MIQQTTKEIIPKQKNNIFTKTTKILNIKKFPESLNHLNHKHLPNSKNFVPNVIDSGNIAINNVRLYLWPHSLGRVGHSRRHILLHSHNLIYLMINKSIMLEREDIKNNSFNNFSKLLRSK